MEQRFGPKLSEKELISPIVNSRKSKRVESKQTALHPSLAKYLTRHIDSAFRRPCAAHSYEVITRTLDELSAGFSSFVLDLGCGTGCSSLILGNSYPDSAIIGVDKSLTRVSKSKNYQLPKNVRIVRADLIDTISIISQSKWPVSLVTLYYPNPWPKKKHLLRRIYAHPIFPLLLALDSDIELRTNWSIFAKEFEFSCKYLGRKKVFYSHYCPEKPVSLFEKKYLESGHELFQVLVEKN